MKRRVDLTNQKFGRLTALYPCRDAKLGTPAWECSCECGKLVVRTTKSLQRSLKDGRIASCGCFKIEYSKESIKPLIGHSTLPIGVAARNRVIKTYKDNARKTNKAWNLSTEQAEILFKENCHYCNAEPSNTFKGGDNYNGDYVYNGIDRLDSDQGYTEDNVVSCCFKCNRAKSNMTLQEFDVWLNAIRMTASIKPFYMLRTVDVSGTSGVGVVATGVVLPTGKAVLEWLSKHSTVTIFENIEGVQAIHSHGGRTKIIFGDHKFDSKCGTLKKYIEKFSKENAK